MKIINFIIAIFISLISTITLADQTQPFAIKTYGNITPTQESLMTNAFLYLNKFWADKGKSLITNTTAKYFTPNTTLIINGKTIYTGYDQFANHFKTVSQSITGKIRFPLAYAIGTNDKLIVRFDEDLRDNNGNNYPVNVMAIFTLKDNKIERWDEVANTQYFCTPESTKVVFSK